MSRNNDKVFKLLLVGDRGVGKSSIALLFSDPFFRKESAYELVLDCKYRTDLDGKGTKLLIWETANISGLRVDQRRYYQGTDGIIVVYDVTNKESFENVKHWLEESNHYANRDVNRLLLGNKSDLTKEKVVDYKQATEYAESMNIPFLEVSAKNASNVEHALLTIVNEIEARMANPPRADIVRITALNKPQENSSLWSVFLEEIFSLKIIKRVYAW